MIYEKKLTKKEIFSYAIFIAIIALKTEREREELILKKIGE
ncbi:hypothetical protein [Campylobacter coli]|nr:hypothetical protein [Campylobacter coli]